MTVLHLPPAALDAAAAEYQRIRRDADNVSGRDAVTRIVGALQAAGVVIAAREAAGTTPAGFDAEATRHAR